MAAATVAPPQSKPLYCATPISKHLSRTPEGYLLARGCTVARSGYQTYKLSELFDGGSERETVEVYRAPSEISAPRFLASLVGKSICDAHPSGFLSADNDAWYSRGTILAPRVESVGGGDVAIVADLLIRDSFLIGKILNGSCRELSVGYLYELSQTKDGALEMVDLLANHLAIVPMARANAQGYSSKFPKAMIRDSANLGKGKSMATDEKLETLERVIGTLATTVGKLSPKDRAATDAIAHGDRGGTSLNELAEELRASSGDDAGNYGEAMRSFLGVHVTAGLDKYRAESAERRKHCRPALVMDSASREAAESAAASAFESSCADARRRMQGK